MQQLAGNVSSDARLFVFYPKEVVTLSVLIFLSSLMDPPRLITTDESPKSDDNTSTDRSKKSDNNISTG